MKLKVGTKTGLRYFGMTELRSWRPCYNPTKYLPEGFRGTALSILDHKEIPPRDKVWVILRTALVSEKLMRLFAVKVARLALSQAPKTDPRSFTACDVAEQFVLGMASREQLSAALAAARDAREGFWNSYAATDAASAYAAAHAVASASAAVRAAASAASADAAAAAGRRARIDQVAILREMIIAEGLARVAAKQKKEVA